ncbi:PAS domain-containing protein [Streptomyces sp. ISL-1]|uniref:PAS domain-containing protein n=1 Tax=Streptomyces sp. ISL-1 TaxID=2817657 RepID=UPI001BE76F77|nr:PAS domain-containing protein [Streptomyces sp. ISL-1]MBT2393267.1 PAS domain-containing protein [Streptomyces sp. ISL-1]
MTQTDEFGEDLADFVRRVGELRAARGLPLQEQHTLLDAALFELQHVAENLLPRYERLAAQGPGKASGDRAEEQLLKAVFQLLPVPVALIGGDTVVRRMNPAATELTGVRAGHAAGRPLTGVLRPGDRAALRSQVAAVARGEGDRSLRVHLQQRPGEPLLATLAALRTPNEPHPAILVVFQSDAVRTRRKGGSAAGSHRQLPDLAEATRHAELMDLLDSMTTALLSGPVADPEGTLATAAPVLDGRFADWVIADLFADGPPRRTTVLGPAGAGSAGAHALLKKITDQDPADCPLVVETARSGSVALQVRPDDPECFGRDDTGTSVLLQAEVTSLLCLPLRGPRDGDPVLGVLTLFRTGTRLAFSLAEARVIDVLSHHVALAMRRPG